MADYKLPNSTGSTHGVGGEARRLPKGGVGHSDIKRELHLETHLDNTCRELSELLLSKHKDYGPKNISQAPGGAVNGLRVRMHDKLARLNHLVDKGDTPNYETVEDTLVDLANYAIIGLLVQRGQWEGIPSKE